MDIDEIKKEVKLLSLPDLLTLYRMVKGRLGALRGNEGLSKEQISEKMRGLREIRKKKDLGKAFSYNINKF